MRAAIRGIQDCQTTGTAEVIRVTMTQKQDVVDMLLEQHGRIKSLFSQVTAAQGEEKRERFEDLVRLLAVHETAEEEVVHPTARQKIEGGDQIVNSRLQEEDEAKRALAELYDMGVDHPDFNGKLTALAEAVTRHADREEAEEFPRLREKVPEEQLRRMAGAMRAAETRAPTRPHPAVGESASANLLAGPPLAVFDRVRDKVRDWRETNRMGAGA
jgi:hemerythrin superfamily protein